MRTLTTAQTNQLALENRATHMRVSIDRGSSDWVDLSDFEGYNWIDSVEYTIDEDNPVQRATIKLSRQMHQLSLAPLLDGSKLNQGGTIADIGNPIKIETATVAMDTTPASGDWVEVHVGEIDDIDWAASQIMIQSRDDGGRLVDTFIETKDSVYGLAAGDPMEDVIQDILDDHATATTYLYSVNGTDAGLPGTAFNAADSPGFNVIPYKQDQQTVMSAIRRVTQLIGAEVGYKWHDNTSAFQLMFQQPDRPISAQGTLNLSATPPANNETFVVNATTFTAKTSGATGDQFNIGADQRETADNIVTMYNAGSEKDNSFAHRDSNDDVVITWTPGLAGDSIVFTESMAGTTVDGGGTLGGTQAGDDGNTTADYTFASDRYFNVNSLRLSRQDIRNVIEVTFEDTNGDRQDVRIADDASITKYGRRFMKITEASGSQIDTYEEAIAFAGAALADLREPDIDQTITVPYFWPAEIGDVYTFTANGEHYDTDQTLSVVQIRHSLTRTTKKTTLVVRGKPSGGKKRWLRIEGRPGVAPVQTEFVGPSHENKGSQSFDQLLRNSDLNIYTGGTNLPPDGWSVVSGDTWADGSVYWTDSTVITGDKAIVVGDVTAGDSAMAFESAFVPFTEDDLCRVGVIAQGDVAEGSTDVDLEVRWFDSNKVYLSSDTTTVTLNNGAFKRRQSATVQAPSDTRYCRVRITTNRNGADYKATYDKVSLVRETPTIRRVFGTGETVTVSSTAAATLTFPTALSEDIGVDFAAGVWTIVEPGYYQFTAQLTGQNSTNTFDYVLQCFKGAGTIAETRVSSMVIGGSNWAFVTLTTPVVLLDEGDTITWKGAMANCAGFGGTSDIAHNRVGSGIEDFTSGKLIMKADR